MTDIIKSNLAPKPYTIEFSENQFARSYSVYIIELIYNEKQIYFIENLCEHQGIGNKFSFKRLARHFEDIASSKNNQIYKYLYNDIIDETNKTKARKNKITDEDKWLIEKTLQKSKLKMHVYPLIKFEFDKLSKKEHKDNVLEVKRFENQLKRRFKKSGKNIINPDIETSVYMRYEDVKFPKIWEEIRNKFKL